MSDTQSKTYRGGFSVSLPLSNPTGGVTYHSVEIHQDIEQHDMALVEVRSRFNDYLSTMSTGSPIEIRYRNNLGSSAVFIGYITSIEPRTAVEDDKYVRVLTCVAASREFRNTARNVWRNRTAPEIVQDIGKKLGFRVVTEQHGLRRKHISQGGSTYWELLVKLAKMTGYVLRAEGTTLYFLPLKKMVQGFASVAPVLADRTMLNQYRVGITEMSADVGNTSDDDDDLSDAAVVVGFGPNDKDPYDVKELPGSAVRGVKATRSAYEKFNPQTVAHSRADAKYLAKGMADRGLMAFDARIVGQGDPMIAPYRPVFVASKDRTLSGYWIVKSVVHKIVLNNYVCTTVVSQDEVTPQRADPPAARFRDLASESTLGWSPFTNSTSRVKVVDPSFVIGKTFRTNGKVAQWVSV